MIENFRAFETGPDPFGRSWSLKFLWQQNGISIRHADTIDVKYELGCEGEKQDKIIALPHPHLLAVSKQLERPITDSWCMRLAGSHLMHMISTWEDMDKTLVTLNQGQIENLAQQLQAEPA
jgi:hypothetical protein